MLSIGNSFALDTLEYTRDNELDLIEKAWAEKDTANAETIKKSAESFYKMAKLFTVSMDVFFEAEKPMMEKDLTNGME